MASNLRDRNSISNRRPRRRRPNPDHSENTNENAAEGSAVPNSSSESGDFVQNPNPNASSFFNEEQLGEISLQHLEYACKEVISKLVSLGYDEDAALIAVLCNGDWRGEKDVLENIFQNSLSYFDDDGNSVSSENPKPSFSDLRPLLKCSLAAMVRLLRKLKPHFSKIDAMWCLLTSRFNVSRACTMEVPFLSPPNGNGNNVVVPSATDFFRGRNVGSMNLQYPKMKFSLTPLMKALMERNVSVFSAGHRENTKHLQNQSQASLGSLRIGDSLGLTEMGGEEESLNFMNDDAINSVLSKYRDLHIQSTETGRVPIDQNEEAILSLINQIKDLEKEVKESKSWAHQKVVQAGRKLVDDIAELKMLRTERDEAQQLKKFAEMENALRKASGQLDRVNSAVKKLENENAEIRAEMEASRLSASESQKTYMEASKREKKCLKKFSALEKQNSKLQDDIAAEIHQISGLQKQLGQSEAGQKEAEVKWRQEQTAKEQGLAQVEEEGRNKEADKASIKRMLEAMRLKLEMDIQRHKDDFHLLERELSQLNLQSHDLSMQNLNGEDSAKREAIDTDRRCIFCSKDDVSVVFLPCAHYVLCAKCNDDYGKEGKAACPCCQVPIQKRISVFGASS